VSEAVVTMTIAMAPVTAMTEAVATVHAVSAAVSTMPTTVTTVPTSRSRGDSGSGQSERGNCCESDFAKHYLYSPFARRDCLMRLSDAPHAEIVRNIFLNSRSGNADKHWIF
jgi:hypothetical protein